MTVRDWQTLALSALLLAAAACLPLTGDAYLLTIGITVAMYAVLATSWALFSGPTHYISLATAAFFGIGTYTTALGIENGMNYWLTLPVAAVRPFGMTYSRFIDGLSKSGIVVDRKVLSDLAINEPAAFQAIAEKAKAALAA